MAGVEKITDRYKFKKEIGRGAYGAVWYDFSGMGASPKLTIMPKMRIGRLKRQRVAEKSPSRELEPETLKNKY